MRALPTTDKLELVKTLPLTTALPVTLSLVLMLAPAPENCATMLASVA